MPLRDQFRGLPHKLLHFSPTKAPEITQAKKLLEVHIYPKTEHVAHVTPLGCGLGVAGGKH